MHQPRQPYRNVLHIDNCWRPRLCHCQASVSIQKHDNFLFMTSTLNQ